MLRLQADVATKRGNYAQAEKLALATITLSEELQNQDELASSLLTLISIYFYQGKFEKAKVAGEESLLILRRIGSKRREGLVLRHLSSVHQRMEHYQTALTLMKQSLNIFLKLNLVLNQAFSYLGLALLYKLLGDLEAAEEAKQAAYQLAKKLNHQPLLNRIRQEF